MGGPVMIEGGGLGKFKAQEVGPAEEQVQSGVVDILVDDEAQAVAAAKKFLSYWQGPVQSWTCEDQTHLRGAIPADRHRMYDLRKLLALLADSDSVLELRHGFGRSMLTAFIRVEGRPIGVIANDPGYLGGAIDSDAADKAARFMQLCDFYGLPVLSMVDTPGIMVGPPAERTGIVRHGSRVLLTGANLSVPLFVVVTRKAYGLGKVAMSAGAFRSARFSVSWPTAEFGPMNLEGAVRLSHRKELEAISDPAERKALFDKLLAAEYEGGKALSRAMDLETDDVIDPAWTRSWISMGLKAADNDPPGPRTRPFLDAW
jgi:acetyl-CoA carboxylase carboxyltransferase component